MAVSCKRTEWDFPGSSVVKTLHSTKGGINSILGWGTKVSHAMRGGRQKNKRLGRRGSLGRYYDVLARVRWKKRQDQGRENKNELGVYSVPGDVPGMVPM